jgi:hypothetical protein
MYNALNVFQDIIVPQSDYGIAFSGQPLRPHRVPCGLLFIAMMSAIDFDDKPLSSAEEVYGIWPHRSLPPEFGV